MDSSRIRIGLLVVLSLSAMAVSMTACGNDVSASSVDEPLALMTGARQPACALLMQFSDGPAEFRCGDYFCYVEPHATDHGYGHVIEGASYYDCDDRYSARALAAERPGNSYVKWEKCVVEDDGQMEVLSTQECRHAAWMPGMWG
jgi:hypothetical protein